MDWLPSLIKKYIDAREKQVNQRLFTFKSWNNRSKSKTRNKEIEYLFELEISFNQEWIKVIETEFSNRNVNEIQKKEILLIINNHLLKQKSRGLFLIIAGALLALIFKILGSDVLFSITLMGGVILLLGERMFIGDISNSLEEFKNLVEYTVNET